MTATYEVERKLDAAELGQARRYLEQTKDYVIGATRGLSAAQWHFSASADRWSIAENLEHMVIVLERVLGPVREQLAQAPAAPMECDPAQVDAVVLQQFPMRSERISAPPVVQPTGRWTPAVALERLQEDYRRMIEILETTAGLRLHAIEALPMKVVSKGAHQFMDGYQWLLAAAAHTERHAKQMIEVKADARFPA